MTGWLIVLVLSIMGFLLFFLVIARKGRLLRRNAPLPPKASKAQIEWLQNGSASCAEVVSPFYVGRSSKSDLLLSQSRAPFEICIFYHQGRFAFQSLDGAGVVLVNGEEILAGYLRDGDVMQIAGQEFIFRCR